MADITKINLNGTALTIVDSAATSAIAGEIARAQGAESAITSALSAEVVARESADTALQTAIGTKADSASTYTKTEVDTALAGKANTATTYTKSEVDTALAGKQNTLSAGTGIQISGDVISCTVDTGLYVVVTTLPAQPAAGNENKIHLVPLASGETQNMYAEYIWKGDAWEKLGEKQIDTDLTDYWTSAETQSAITEAIGENLQAYDNVEAVLDMAGIAYYDTENEEYVVNPVATYDDVVNQIGENLYAYGSVETVLTDAGIISIEDDGEGNINVNVNSMATEDYVNDQVSGITASYSAATETLILNIPNPSA